MLRLLVLTSLTSVFRATCTTAAVETTAAGAMALKAVDFEVFGRVQGVFFRKYTKQEADKLGLRGWCLNTSKGTVLGHMEGPADKIETMTQWLKTKGSPSSLIDKADIWNQKDIATYEYDSFKIRRDDDIRRNEMMDWLKTKGSPSSKIEKTEFKNQKEIKEYEYTTFDIRPDA